MNKTILFLAANPSDTTRLRLDKEMSEIKSGLKRAAEKFAVHQQEACRPKDVRRAMLEAKPGIVHFCGHGEGEGGIAFENENGDTAWVSTASLAGFFKLFAEHVGCVVLNACYSEVQAEAIAQHVDYVIGMNNAIHDKAAIKFAVAFYDLCILHKRVKVIYTFSTCAVAIRRRVGVA